MNFNAITAQPQNEDEIYCAEELRSSEKLRDKCTKNVFVSTKAKFSAIELPNVDSNSEDVSGNEAREIFLRAIAAENSGSTIDNIEIAN